METLEGSKDVQYGGFWIRTLSALVDGILLSIVIVPISLIFIGGKPYEHPILNFTVNWIVPALYTLLFWKYTFSTPGKMLFHLKIVDAKTRTPPSMGKLVLRYLAYFISLIPLGLGYLWVAWDKKKQGFHDKIAGTLIVTSLPEGKTKDKHLVWKVILSLLLAGTLLLVGAVGAGMVWWSRNKDTVGKQLGETLKSMNEEAVQFGKTHTQKECLEEALLRHDDCGSFPCHIKNNIFLIETLRSGQPSRGFCEDVPKTTQFMKTVTWRVKICDDLGRSGDYCRNLMGTVQKHCDNVSG